MYVKIWRHQHTRVNAHTGPRRHARAPACHRHHMPRLVRAQAGIAHTLVCVIDQREGKGGGVYAGYLWPMMVCVQCLPRG